MPRCLAHSQSNAVPITGEKLNLLNLEPLNIPKLRGSTAHALLGLSVEFSRQRSTTPLERNPVIPQEKNLV